MKKGPECAYDKWNICEVICDTDIRNGQPSHGGDHKVLKVLKWWFLPIERYTYTHNKYSIYLMVCQLLAAGTCFSLSSFPHK